MSSLTNINIVFPRLLIIGISLIVSSFIYICVVQKIDSVYQSLFGFGSLILIIETIFVLSYRKDFYKQKMYL